ncbi:hypothetical protein EC973_008361 [Apophysomyces ossiformis]|uniref:Uncharacterized protein n=1 Tax=Apophysomyces ossiformis TaxID=679940 RepID=A0A8H7BNH4_9FUNG|nr:hypothetical protein EC973_008361 [Apophysomyces ossiformis]
MISSNYYYRTQELYKPPKRTSRMDPAAEKWLTFVEETSQSDPKRDRALNEKVSTNAANTTITAKDSTESTTSLIRPRWKELPPSSNGSGTHKKRQSISDHDIDRKLKLMPDPPRCFCGKTASQMHTPEFGTIYECHDMNAPTKPPCDMTNEHIGNAAKVIRVPTHICGFHVHQRAWDQFRKTLETGSNVDHHHPELDVCPAFNYTFCVIFRAMNEFPKRPPPVPRCFCNMPVIMRKITDAKTARMSFTCKNFDVEGAKPKCSWILWAEEVPFIKPRYPLHAVGRASKSEDAKESEDVESASKQSESPTKSPPDQPEQMTFVLRGGNAKFRLENESDQKEHAKAKMEPKATQNLSKETMLQLLCKAKMPDMDHMDTHIETKGMKTGSQRTNATYDGPKELTPSSSISEESDSSYATYYCGISSPMTSNSDYIQQLIQMPIEEKMSRQIVGTLCRSLDCRPEHLVQKFLQEIQRGRVESEIEKQKYIDEIAELKRAAESKESTIQRLYREKKEFDTTVERLHQLIDAEMETRRNNQKRAIKLEVQMSELLIESETLKEEIQIFKEKITSKDMKCRVCFHNNIDTALVPCFHCGKFYPRLILVIYEN